LALFQQMQIQLKGVEMKDKSQSEKTIVEEKENDKKEYQKPSVESLNPLDIMSAYQDNSSDLEF